MSTGSWKNDWEPAKHDYKDGAGRGMWMYKRRGGQKLWGVEWSGRYQTNSGEKNSSWLPSLSSAGVGKGKGGYAK